MSNYRISGAGNYQNPFVLAGTQRQQTNPFVLPQNGQKNGQPVSGSDIDPYALRPNQNQQYSNARRRQQDSKRPQSLEQLNNQLQQQEKEVQALRRQLEGIQDPQRKKSLEQTMQQKTAGLSSLQGMISLQYKGLSSGFAGQENKVDHIGSFITQV